MKEELGRELCACSSCPKEVVVMVVESVLEVPVELSIDCAMGATTSTINASIVIRADQQQ